MVLFISGQGTICVHDTNALLAFFELFSLIY